jgi:hypothetical protein
LPVFRHREIDIETNETAMSRTGFGFVSAQPAGNGFVATTISPPTATTQALPPDTIELVIDPSQGKTITIGDHQVHLIDFNSNGVHYQLQ